MHRRSLALAAALAVFAALLAGRPAVGVARPLDAARLPAGATGVGHLDAEALRKTKLFALVAGQLPKPELGAGRELDAVAALVLAEARGATFWIDDHESGAILIEVADGAKLQRALDKVPTVRAARVAGRVARVLKIDGEENWFAQAGDILVVSDDEPGLRRTLEVLSGRAKAGAHGKLLSGSRDGGLFFFVTLDRALLEKVKDAASSATLQADLVSLKMSVGEVNGELRARVSAAVATPEAAQKLKSVIDGVRALVSLADDSKQIQPMLDRIEVVVSGKRIEVKVAMPIAELIKAMAAAAAAAD